VTAKLWGIVVVTLALDPGFRFRRPAWIAHWSHQLAARPD
jgi:hypothetical protein